MGKNPLQDRVILKQNIGSSVVISRNSSLAEIVVVRYFHLEDSFDLLLAPARILISGAQSVIGGSGPFRAVIFIVLRHKDVHRYAVFGNGRIFPS